ncbi:MAG: aminotransferase class I/II-fold pyridoxal phosphate-dependent enzyme, partial [Gaiellaceae bacterium]
SPGAISVYPDPSFVCYASSTLAGNMQARVVPLREHLHYDVEAMSAALTPDAKLFFLANPNNPTGSYLGGRELERLLSTMPEHVIAVIDEAYVEFVTARQDRLLRIAYAVCGDANRAEDVFVHDRKTGRTTRLSVDSHGRQANGGSWFPAISADGRYVAFQSLASNLVRVDTNKLSDVFVRDLATVRTTRVSVDSRGAQARCNAGPCESTSPVLSAHGRYVAFQSSATNLVPHDTNRLGDVFVHDRRTGKTIRVSVRSDGKQAAGDRTHPGRNAPAISADGRFVAFHSLDTNVVPGDTNRTADVFVRDLKRHRTTRVSVSSADKQSNGESLGGLTISADGRFVAFTSLASNLVPRDANDITDVFLRDLRTGTTTLASRGIGGVQGNDASAVGGAGSGLELSNSARVLAFSSWAGNFVPGDTNGRADAFVRKLRR